MVKQSYFVIKHRWLKLSACEFIWIHMMYYNMSIIMYTSVLGSMQNQPGTSAAEGVQFATFLVNFKFVINLIAIAVY